MKKEEITALAREYAEWVTKDYGKENAYIPGETATASIFLRWLTRRFLLVEKSKVKSRIESAYEAKREERNGCFGIVRWQELNYLFPEIAKEVEG